MKKCLTAISIGFISIAGFSQTTNKEYLAVDEYVKKLGSYDTLNMGSISLAVTKNFASKELKARAIYDWVCNNIAYDIKAGKNNDASKSATADVLKYRKAIGSGYANLFQDMCSSANIRCLTVDGFAKRTTEEIEEKKSEINHTWAVVQLGQSPETWFYVDPCFGAGFPDKKGNTFIKSFDDGYFFSAKKIFNNQHYPDNEAWKLGDAPKTKKAFYELPLIKTGAYNFSVSGFVPATGIVKIKPGKSLAFNLTAANTSAIIKVALMIENNKKQTEKVMNYNIAAGHIIFEYKFNDDGEFPVSIMINDKEVLQYLVMVE